jgi:cytochrome c biogenesis protein ResB
MKTMLNNIRTRIRAAADKGRSLILDRKGEVAVNTIGAIIIAVVIIGLLVVAINAFFPGFFTGMFNSMQQKLNANW